MCTIHNDPGTGSPRPRTPASGVPAVLTSVVAALLLFCVAPHGHAQTNPVLSISAETTIAEGDSGTTALTWFVVLTPASSDTVTVKYADAGTGTATSGTDYVAVTAETLTFDPGDTVKTVRVTVNGDTDDEPNETVVIKLSEPANAQFAGGAATAEGTGTIENDDDPVLSIDAPRVREGSSGTTTLTFTVTLSAASSDTITVAYEDDGTGTATSGTDYDAVNAGTLTFAANETEQTIDVTVNGDADIGAGRDRRHQALRSRPTRSSPTGRPS